MLLITVRPYKTIAITMKNEAVDQLKSALDEVAIVLLQFSWISYRGHFLTEFRHDIGACKVSFEATQGCASVDHKGHFDPVAWGGPAP